MNRIEQAAYFGHMMGKSAAGQGLGAGQSNKEVDDILNSFRDSEKPVDPKALMADRPVRVGAGESTFSPNPLPARRPQLSNKDISGMQGAFGGKQPQKPMPGAGGQQNMPPIPRK
jgi:hypothetical protein